MICLSHGEKTLSLCERSACRLWRPLGPWRWPADDRLNNMSDWVVYGLLCWGGCEKCMGNEGRGVAYVTIDDTKLAF